jgi:regulator of protease activity HflC (stomatin/prohibitin superfamily)
MRCETFKESFRCAKVPQSPPKRGTLMVLGLVFLAMCVGCAGTIIEPGHRGLVFDPKHGGLQHEVLQPGYHSGTARIDDFDVTYSTRTEELHVQTAEGLQLTAHLSIVYRPIISELYQLDTEIGRSYYDEVVGPEFRSATRGCFAKRSYLELQRKNEQIENEVEAAVRRRTAGKHVEIASVVLESVELPPEIGELIREKVVVEQKLAKQKLELESEAARAQRESEIAWEREKLELERNVERERLKREALDASRASNSEGEPHRE